MMSQTTQLNPARSSNAEHDRPSTTSPRPLTPKQKQVLDFIEVYIDEHSYSPLIDEIRVGVGGRSKSTVHEHLGELEKRGYIEKERGIARGISLLQLSTIELHIAPDRALERAKELVQGVSTFQEAYQTIVLGQILSLTRARSISLYLVAEREGEVLLEPRLWLGCWKHNEPPRAFSANEGLAGNVWTKGRIFTSGDVQKEQWFTRSKNPRSRTVRSMMVVPILDFERNVVGVLNLDSSVENRFSGSLQTHIETFTEDFHSALITSQLRECLRGPFAIDFFLCLFKNAVSQYLSY